VTFTGEERVEGGASELGAGISDRSFSGSTDTKCRKKASVIFAGSLRLGRI
jgi:hypothetical protein